MTAERLISSILAHPECDYVIKTARARNNNAKRVTHSGGRPIVLRPCPRCGVQCGTRALRVHRCEVKA